MKRKTIKTILAKAKTCSPMSLRKDKDGRVPRKSYTKSWVWLVWLHLYYGASLGGFTSYPQRSSTRRACRKAFAVSLGAAAKRLSKRLHAAERRDGVTRAHCLGGGAERGESWGSRGDAASCWPIIENKHENYHFLSTLWLCTIFTNPNNQRSSSKCQWQMVKDSPSAQLISTLKPGS